jgi:hypothetical protein
MLEIHECVFRPQSSAEFLSPDNFAVCFEKEPKDLQRLILNWHTNTREEQLAAAPIDLKRIESRPCPAE